MNEKRRPGSTAASRFRWRRVILLTLGVGVTVGVGIGVLDTYFGIAFPTILGGVISSVIIAIALALGSRPSRP